jgi:general secretion pathway protein H
MARAGIHHVENPTGRARRGLTMIEIMVVLLIMGLIMGSVAMTMGAANQAEIVRTTNQLASTIRFAYDRARFTGSHYRLHIDFEERTFQLQKADSAMYLPSTDRNGELVETDMKKLADQAKRDEQAAESYYSSIAAAVYSAAESTDMVDTDPYAVQKKDVPRRRPPMFQAFEADATLGDLGQPIQFPDDVQILSVQTDADIEPITEGEADIYFFPRGQTQLAAIQLQGTAKLRERIAGDDEIAYTILIQPLTGKVTVESGLIDLELPEVLGDTEDALGNKTERRSF